MYIGCDERIYVSSKTESGWTAPMLLNDSINQPGWLNEAPSISPDGKTLYFRKYVGQWRILQSKWNDSLGLWGTPADMGFNINQYSGWQGMTPDNKHFFFHPGGTPRISVWNDTTSSWGPSRVLDAYRFLGVRGGLCVLPSLRKIYYDSYDPPRNNLYVNYFDTNSGRWSSVMKLNLNSMIDSLPSNQGHVRFYPWVMPDKKSLYFSSDHEGSLAIYMSKLVIDENGIPVSVSDDERLNHPHDYKLYQNSPNPFNSSTHIRFEIPVQSQVRLTILNLLGEMVTEVLRGDKDPGVYEVEWDGKTSRGIPVASGLYFYRFNATSASGGIQFSLTKPMLLIR